MHGPHALARTVAPMAVEIVEEAVAFDGGANLLRARRDEQRRLGAEPSARRPASDRRRLGDVLVGRVGARSDERDRDRSWARRARVPTTRPRRGEWLRSGVSGPLIMGRSADRSISMTRSKNRSGSASTSGSARRSPATASAASAISRAERGAEVRRRCWRRRGRSRSSRRSRRPCCRSWPCPWR